VNPRGNSGNGSPPSGARRNGREREIRTLDEVRRIREEVVLQDARKCRSRRFEGGDEKVAQRVGDFGCDDGRDHGREYPVSA